MSVYVFEDKDILNSRISSGSRVLYTTNTTISIIHRKTTMLCNSANQPIGAIRWKDGGVEIEGVIKGTDVIKIKPHVFFNSDWERIWQWDPSGPQYTVRYSGGQWSAKESSTGAIHALLTPYRFHLFRDSEPASISYAQGVHEFDKFFLLLILIRMETRRQDEKKRRRRAGTNTNNVTMF